MKRFIGASFSLVLLTTLLASGAKAAQTRVEQQLESSYPSTLTSPAKVDPAISVTQSGKSTNEAMTRSPEQSQEIMPSTHPTSATLERVRLPQKQAQGNTTVWWESLIQR